MRTRRKPNGAAGEAGCHFAPATGKSVGANPLAAGVVAQTGVAPLRPASTVFIEPGAQSADLQTTPPGIVILFIPDLQLQTFPRLLIDHYYPIFG